MIANPDRTTLVSSMGWVDHDALWVFDVSTVRAERLPMGSGARYLSLHSSGTNRFSVCHRFDGAGFELTVRNFADPARVQAHAILNENQNQITGDASAWGGVPLLYVDYLRFEPWQEFVLLKIRPESGDIHVQRLEWYDETYDKGYQGIIGVLEVPGEDFAIVRSRAGRRANSISVAVQGTHVYNFGTPAMKSGRTTTTPS
jgi:hypothetical protein